MSRKRLTPHSPNFARRKFIQGIPLALSAPFVLRMGTYANAQGMALNFASYGGTYGDAIKKAWLDPFEKETGMKVNLGANANLALAKLQVANPGGAEWDIVDLTGSEYDVAVRENVLLKLDPSKVDTSKIEPTFVKSHAFGYAQYIWGIGWDRNRIPDDKTPQNWADFWDVKKYAGKRSLIQVKTQGVSLQAALMADGVDAAHIYPIDIERALKSLEKLGKRNIIWQTSNQEPVQHLMSGQAPLAGMYVGRALIANRSGANLGFTLDGASIGGDWLGVIRTAKNADAAFQLLNYIATRADRAAEFTAITSYPVPIKGVEDLIPPTAKDVLAVLPSNPAVRDKLLYQDDAWWNANLERAITRFTEWQLS